MEVPPLDSISASLEKFSFICEDCSIDLHPSHFSRCEKLQSLRIENSGVTTLLWLIPISSSIITVSLNSNRITSLESMYHIKFYNLEKLSLSGNLIDHVEPSSLSLPVLRAIELQSNKMKYITFHGCRWGAKRREQRTETKIDLFRNSWDCREDFTWLNHRLYRDGRERACVIERGAIRLDIRRVSRMICAFPTERRGQRVINFINSPQPQLILISEGRSNGGYYDYKYFKWHRFFKVVNLSLSGNLIDHVEVVNLK